MYITEYGTLIRGLSGRLICRTKLAPIITGASGIITKVLKEKCERNTRKAFNAITTEDSFTCNITRSRGWTAA
jgi:hypothetical protein